MNKKRTLKSLAKELDVSISTVSKALKGSLEISKDTKERIQAFAEFYNYRPNTTALSLKNQNTKTIGVIIPDIVHYFFSSVIKGIENVANSRGYNVIIGLSNNLLDKEQMNFQTLADGRAEGIIVSVGTETQLKANYEHISKVIQQGLPIVMFDRVVDSVSCDKVLIDDRISAKKATQYFIEHGCQDIGIISTPDYINVGKLRTEGYREALQSNGLEVDQMQILKLEDDNQVQSKINHFVGQSELDGILTVNEKFAAQTGKALRKLGKKIPEDVSIISFTDGIISRNLIPSLTTVDQHGEQMGTDSANLLIDRLEDQDSNKLKIESNYQHKIIETDLIIRESVKS